MNKRYSGLAAIVVAAVCFFAARLPALKDSELALLAGRFKFTKHFLPEVPNCPPYQMVRQVHPSLERISAWVSSVGAAATLADIDGDGLGNDVIYVDPRTGIVTVAPVPGTPARFQPFALDVTFWSHNGYDVSTVAPMGTVVGDFDEDGATDLLVYFWGRTPILYMRQPGNKAPLSPTSYSARELVDSGERWFTDCATQADFDGDGHIDLLVGNYFQDGARILDPKATDTVTMHQGKAKALNGGYKHILLWQGAASFREVTNVFREDIARGWTVALGAADLDGDLLPEIYFAHDFGPDRLLHNRSKPGRLEFVELVGRRDLMTPKSCVLGNDSFKGMGCDFGDINGDGLPDIYVSNIATKFGLTESHFLWESTGRTGDMKQGLAPYTQNSEKLGLSRSGFGWDARLADFDNDGVFEAMQACGFIKGKINRWPELQALGTSNDKVVHNPRFWPSFKPGADLSGQDCNAFFVRGADGRYHDVAHRLDFAGPMVTRGLAVGDVDGDGRLDVVCANQWEPSVFFRNESPGTNAFLGLRLLRGAGSPAIGATATVTLSDQRKLVGQLDGGSGHSGRRSPEIHFGLGATPLKSAVPVEIKWRDSAGIVRQRSQQLTPGWHTVRLPDNERLTMTTTTGIAP